MLYDPHSVTKPWRQAFDQADDPYTARNALGVPADGSITTAAIAAKAVTNPKLADMAQATIKGRAVAAGTGVPTDLTATQAAAIIGSVGGALLSKCLTLTRDMTLASGNVAYTGVGFQPTAIIFFGVTAISNAQTSFGFSDSAKAARSICYYTTVASFSAASCIVLFDVDGSGTKAQSGIVNSYDSDGFTLAWTKTGVPSALTATVYALCLR